MDILSMLQADHRKFLAAIEGLDSRIFDPPNKYHSSGFSSEASLTATRVLRELLPQLDHHERVEHELLFPEMLRRSPQSEQALEGMAREHGGLRGMIARVMLEFPESSDLPMTRSILEVVHLGNVLKSHFLREEMEIYKEAQRILSKEERARLGELAERMLAGT